MGIKSTLWVCWFVAEYLYSVWRMCMLIISSQSSLSLDLFPKKKDSLCASHKKSEEGVFETYKEFFLTTEPYLRCLNKYTAPFGQAGQSYFKVQPWTVKHCSHSACFFPLRLLSRLSWVSKSKLCYLWCNYLLVKSLSSGQNCKLGE